VSVYTSANNIENRLAELDLSPSDLRETCLRAYGHWADHTDLDPASIANTNLWGRATRVLRELLLPRGWEPDNSDQQPRTVHPSRQWAVIVSSGDAGTGLPSSNPSTKNPKGGATIRKVAINQAQLVFPGFSADLPAAETCISWILLIHVSQAEIRAELSLPAEISESGFVTKWAERIILEPIPRGEGDELFVTNEEDDGPDFNVAVELR
jgi:hypothetical protein